MKKLQISPTPAGTLKLDGSLDIYGADELRTQLIDRLNSTGGILLDLSGVDGCDVTGVQLLCAARKSAADADKPFQIHAVSSAFQEACAGLGVPSNALTTINMTRNNHE